MTDTNREIPKLCGARIVDIIDQLAKQREYAQLTILSIDYSQIGSVPMERGEANEQNKSQRSVHGSDRN